MLVLVLSVAAVADDVCSVDGCGLSSLVGSALEVVSMSIASGFSSDFSSGFSVEEFSAALSVETCLLGDADGRLATVSPDSG